MKKKPTQPRPTDVEKEESPEITDTPSRFPEMSYESPNRVVLPRKIGKRRPEEERGYKPTVI